MAGNNIEIEWLKGLGVASDFGATLSTVPENQPGTSPINQYDQVEKTTTLSSSTLKVWFGFIFDFILCTCIIYICYFFLNISTSIS